LQLTHDGYGLTLNGETPTSYRYTWAQGAVGATSGKHFFNVTVTAPGDGHVVVGFVDGKVSATDSALARRVSFDFLGGGYFFRFDLQISRW
jgi:hypothetical protein